ncbi:MAG: exoribonuclease II [Psittacicella sp.]
MLFDNQALAQLKKSFKKEEVFVEGIVKSHEKGFGFLETQDQSYFINPINMRKVLSGDIIQAKIEPDNRGGEQAVPTKLVEMRLKQIVAQVVIRNTKSFLDLSTDIQGFKEEVSFSTDLPIELKPKDWVLATIVSHPLRDHKIIAKVTKFICHNNDPFLPWWVTLNKFEQHEEIYLENNEKTFIDNELRKDYTDFNFVTIDSESTLDIDDALYIKRNESFWSLYIAIADPTSFVTPDSTIDKHALEMGFTQYLPTFNIPLIPRVLSEDIFSLKEGEKRPAVICKININFDGSIDESNISFDLGEIISKSKLSYDEVSNFLDKGKDIVRLSKDIKDELLELHEFMKARSSYRDQNSIIFMERPDYSFKIGDKGEILDIIASERTTSNKVVEEAMIAANISAASYFKSHKAGAIFNTHLGYLELNLNLVKSYLKEKLDPKDYSLIESNINNIDNLEDYIKVNQFLIKNNYLHLSIYLRQYLGFVEFSSSYDAHYAMGLKGYATWTSPIRKYSDMINHRVLKNLIKDSKSDLEISQEVLDKLLLAKRKNRQVERAVLNWLYDLYFKKEEKSTIYEADIVDIIKPGFRVNLSANGASVFIPFATLQDAITLPELKEFSVKNKEYKLGDKVKVKVDRINPINHKLTGSLVI